MGDGFGRVTHHPEYYLSDGSVSFLTGNILFKVHKSFFERESDFFCNHFAQTAADDPLEGTDARPFTLDVTADDFSKLLWVWYDRAYSYHQQSKANWVVILRLASRWSFPRVKDLALRELDVHGLSPVERISIYTTHRIEDDDRLLDSYVELCKSPVLPTAEDGHLLQMETLINILQAREDAQRRAIKLGHESPTSASLGDETLREIVSRFFKKGLGPRSDGHTSTGSGFQASYLNENGERAQKDGPSATITLGPPQVPGQNAPSSGGPAQQMNDSHPTGDKREGKDGNEANPLVGEDKTKTSITTQDEEGEEKEKQAKEQQAKERAESEQQKAREKREKKERQAKEKEAKEKEAKEKEEKEKKEKAQKVAEAQLRPQTSQRRPGGNH